MRRGGRVWRRFWSALLRGHNLKSAARLTPVGAALLFPGLDADGALGWSQCRAATMAGGLLRTRWIWNSG
jgi:hypothetical protein